MEAGNSVAKLRPNWKKLESGAQTIRARLMVQNDFNKCSLSDSRNRLGKLVKKIIIKIRSVAAVLEQINNKFYCRILFIAILSTHKI